MSEPKKSAELQNADLVLINTVSRLGCSVAEAREYLAKQSAAQAQSPAQPAPQQSSKGTSSDEALL